MYRSARIIFKNNLPLSHCQLLKINSFHSNEKIPKICIIGSGPAGFYAAQQLVKSLPKVEVDLIDRSPLPFGLVRYGVAPDHPEVKNVINTFTKTAKHPSVRFAGNISIGKDVTLEDLKQWYNAILLTYGAGKDRILNIPGEDLNNVIPAGYFVGWYNGHPEAVSLKVQLNHEIACVLGQGNVALDVARILLTPIDELRRTDIPEYALALLAESKVKEVFVIGRRGPLQVAFTIKEFREMIKLNNCQTIFENNIFDDINSSILSNLPRPRKRLTELMISSSKGSQKEHSKLFRPLFLRTPKKIEGNSGHVSAVYCSRNQLKNSPDGNPEKAKAVEDLSLPLDKIECGLVLRSIGYRSEKTDPSVPFDDSKGLVPNQEGRVTEGLYSAGWLATGPTGVLLSTMTNAFNVASSIIRDLSLDLQSLTNKPGYSELEKHLKSKDIQIVDWESWERIDAEEMKRGKDLGKPREKITSIKEMLSIAKT